MSVTPTLNPRDGQLIRGQSLLVRLANFVKLPHTVFAMPFALVGVLLASAAHAVTLPMVGWVVLAFTSARFAAMGFNRIVDRDVDAINPRTRMRELPSGALTVNQARASVLFASMLFFYASWRLNTLCLALSPIALVWVLGYSYTKRFTRWSHLWLGLGLSIAPVGGYLAITGMWSDPWWLLCALAMAVVTWSGGFDILYALQDAEFDRSNGLHSIPSSIGVPNSILLARVLHITAVGCLSLLAASAPFGSSTTARALLWLGVGLAAALLVWEHRLVNVNDLSKLDAAFFTMNGIISLTFLACVAAARFAGNATDLVVVP
jgi:4-hydroxybenzoate polyprenyltransferase